MAPYIENLRYLIKNGISLFLHKRVCVYRVFVFRNYPLFSHCLFPVDVMLEWLQC